MSKVEDEILRKLESKEYLTGKSHNPETVKHEIRKFNTWLAELPRKSLYVSDSEDKKEYIDLLIQLKQTIRSVIGDFKSKYKKQQRFCCGLCKEEIIIEPLNDIWESLQNHSHFDQLHMNFLINSLDSDETDDSSCGSATGKEETKKEVENTNTNEMNDKESDDIVEINSRDWYEKNFLENDDDSNSTMSQSSLEDQEDNHCSTQEIEEKAITLDTIQNIKREGNNNFRFNFESRYDPIVEEHLYPRIYQKFKLEEDFIFQRTGSIRTVCLVCQCELLNKRNVKNINSHMSGHRHIKNLTDRKSATILRQYHDIFMSMEPEFQAHQVYFVPDDALTFVKCVICALFVKCCDVYSHILHEPHKSLVLRLRNKPVVRNFFSPLELHLKCYGIHEEVLTENAAVSMKEVVNETKQEKHTPKKSFNEVNRDNDVKEHQIVKSVEESPDKNPITLLPRRFAQHLKFLKLNNATSVSCTACKNGKSSNISPKDLQHHLIQPTHLVATKLSLEDHVFFCEICDMRFRDEITWFMHFKDNNNNKHDSIAASRRSKICEYECVPCKAIIFGDELSLRRHQSSYVRRNTPKKATVLSENVKKFFASKRIIQDNSLKLLAESLKVLKSQEDLKKCCEDMENALLLYDNFENCKAHPFGSRVSGLGSEDSDLDVFIDVGGMYNGISKQEDKCQIKIITIALEYFRKTNQFYRMTSIPTARTPIIKLKHRSTGLDCDISFRHGLSVENTKFLKFCFALQPLCRSLILLLKKWSSLCQLNENITTYALAMMAIFYLQTKGYLASVHYLKSLNPGKSPIIDGWETIAYDKDIPEKTKKTLETYKGNIVDILKDFFKYYSDFNYATEVVCPLLGKTVPKSQFTEDLKGRKLPIEMAVYIKRINSTKDPELFRSLSEFCIQDPFDLSHNLTKACTKSLVDKFQKLCKLTLDILNNL